ncbi:MAG: Ig-like domain repeat protein [Acidimicrobiales bacterium]
MKRRKMKDVLKGSAIALLSAVLVFTVAAACTSIAQSSVSRPKFVITNTISSSSTQQIPALLLPGVTRYLWYTAHNPLSVPITVTSLSISSVSAPPGCPLVNLNDAQTTYSGSLSVSPGGTGSVPVPIALIETHKNQDLCENTAFRFTFAGTATFNIARPTSTAVTSSHDPSVIGQSVTYTATVSAGSGSPSSPTGTVNFFDGSTPICTNVTLPSETGGSSSVMCTPSTYVVGGTHKITAAFSNSDQNFSNSTSPVLTQIVQSTLKTTTIVASGPNPSIVGAPVTLTAKVLGAPPVPSGSSPGGSVSFYLGLPIGTHTLLGTEVLDATGRAALTTSTLPEGSDIVYAVYAGSAQFAPSTSPVIIQVVLAKAGHCSDPYGSWYFGDPGSSSIHGSDGNNYFFLPSGNFQVFGGNGANCFQGGDGDNDFDAGNGQNHVYGGNGSNSISLGSGDDTVQVGDGTNQISAGDGNDTVSIGDGSHNKVVLGNGNDAVTTGSGAYDNVQLGSGSDSVTIGGSQSTILGGNGSESIYLGAGTYNTFSGGGHHLNVCHVPTPPASWHGTTQGYYHDSLTNCTVVTP